MRLTSESGLTLVEVVVVILVLVLLSLMMPRATSSSMMHANMTAVGARGSDIWVAITGANAEREALGLPPLWPRDFDPSVDTNADELAQLDFSNSTDYFRWLHDEVRLATTKGSAQAVGFDYSKLAGAGVPVCPGGSQELTAAYNMWTVAKNVRDDMDDLIPVLITRNIDASSMAARMEESVFSSKSLRFDPNWEAPFDDRGVVLIRKNGAVFKARAEYMSYGVVYQRHTFDTARTPDGRDAPPLKYLTPSGEITPGEQAYAESCRHAGVWSRRVSQAVAAAVGVVLFLSAVYVAAFLRNALMRKRLGLRSPASPPVLGVWLCHYLTVVGYALSALFCLNGFDGWGQLVIGTAFVAQIVGIVLAVEFQRHDRETRKRQILWMLAPFWIMMGMSCLLFPAT